MALFGVILIGLLTIAVLWKFGRVSQGALSLTGAALALGLVGYSLQGDPNLAGAPVAPKPEVPAMPLADAGAQGELIGKFGTEAEAMAQADSYFRIDRPDLAAAVLQRALKSNPNSAALWTGLGNAMVGQGRGVLSPAADYSYKRALKIAPGYPGALYFYGMALAQNGRAEEAKPVFRQLIATIPQDAPFRQKLLADLGRAGLLDNGTTAPAATSK
jgi:cytochrome c-type biogenesis protein CcmH